MKSNLKISIITIVLEGEQFIDEAINSVLSQSYPNIEYIIIDGYSRDTTLEIIAQYKSRISKVTSEPDKGVYYALNKGLEQATGEVIGFLHADDFYAHPHVIENVMGSFEEDTEAVYADLDYVGLVNKNRVVRKWRSGTYHTQSFYNGWMPPHPTFFVRKSVYQKFGGYNTQLRSASDYELMLRLILKHHIKLKYLPEVIVKMRLGGQSNRSLKNRILANLEDRKAWSMNGLKPRIYTLVLKPLRKIFQYF